MSRRFCLSSHMFVTPPNNKGVCYIGLSEYSKKFFSRTNKIDYSHYKKTSYSITNASLIPLFV